MSIDINHICKLNLSHTIYCVVYRFFKDKTIACIDVWVKFKRLTIEEDGYYYISQDTGYVTSIDKNNRYIDDDESLILELTKDLFNLNE